MPDEKTSREKTRDTAEALRQADEATRTGNETDEQDRPSALDPTISKDAGDKATEDQANLGKDE